MKCQYDTGSMYGCQPACSAPATVTATYQPPCYPPIAMRLCARHVSPTAGRVYPATLTHQPEGKVKAMPTIEVHTDDADLTNPRTTFAAWDGRDHIICDDTEADSGCDGTREHAVEHAGQYIEDNPELAAGVYVYAFTPTDA